MTVTTELAQIDWGKLKIFFYVAQARSFTKAAAQLNLTQSAISRSIQTLEKSLGYTLFIRKRAPGIVLTREGEILLEATQTILSTLTLADSYVDEHHNKPRGLLRVYPTVGLFPLFFSAHVAGFLDAYPEMRLAFFETDIAPRLESLEADVIIHPFIESRPDLIQHPLLSLQGGLYASPAYLEKFGTPKCVEDLDHHQLITSSWSRQTPSFLGNNWILTVGKKPGELRTPYIEGNSSKGRMDLAQDGLGILMLTKEMPGLKESNLVPVLPHIEGPVIQFYYTYSEVLKHSKRITTFLEYLQKVL